jgi:hypothetical protein
VGNIGGYQKWAPEIDNRGGHQTREHKRVAVVVQKVGTGGEHSTWTPVPEFIDPDFQRKQAQNARVIENERFGLVFAKTGSIIPSTEVVILVGMCKRYGQQYYKQRVDADLVTGNVHQKRATQGVGIVSTYPAKKRDPARLPGRFPKVRMQVSAHEDELTQTCLLYTCTVLYYNKEMKR